MYTCYVHERGGGGKVQRCCNHRSEIMYTNTVAVGLGLHGGVQLCINVYRVQATILCIVLKIR